MEKGTRVATLRNPGTLNMPQYGLGVSGVAGMWSVR